MKNTLFAVAALILSSSAFAQTETWKKIEGSRSGISQRRAVAVTEAASWEKVWKEHDANAPVPSVDFSKESVVAVFLGETTSAGVKVEVVVQDDMIDSNRLNVFYKEVRTSKPFSATVITRPYAIVKVRKAAVVSFEADSLVSVPEKSKAPANPRDTTKFRVLLETLTVPSFDGHK